MINERKLYTSLGNEIRKLRKSKGYNQGELAAKIRLNRTSVANIELGNQRATALTLYRICELFTVNIEDILPTVQEVLLQETNIQSHKIDDIVVGPKTHAVIGKIRAG